MVVDVDTFLVDFDGYFESFLDAHFDTSKEVVHFDEFDVAYSDWTEFDSSVMVLEDKQEECLEAFMGLYYFGNFKVFAAINLPFF